MRLLHLPPAWLVCSIAVLLCFAGPALAADPDAAESSKQKEQAAPVQLPVVSVEASSPAPEEGSAENGYRTSSASLGSLGTTALKDTPYAVNVVSGQFISNIQAQTVSEALKYNPTVYAASGNNMVGGGASFTIRGFTTNTNESFIDGLRMYARTPIEDKERIEVINGPASFLFGFANPAGTINYVQKRPTDTPFAQITVGDYGGAQGYAHGDFGGPLDADGRFTYRANLLYVDKGDIGIPDDSHERYLGSASLDWHISPKTLLSVDYSHFYIDIEGGDNIFSIGSNVTSIPKAPKASRNYMPSYSRAKDEYDRVAMHFTSELSDAISVRSAVAYSYVDMFRHRASNKITDNDGDYTMSRNYYNQGKSTIEGNTYVDVKFDTGSWRHKVTVGVNEENTVYQYAYPYATGKVSFDGTNNLYNPIPYPPDTYDMTLGDPDHTTEQTNLFAAVLGDQLAFNDQWSLVGGLTLASIYDKQNKYSSTNIGQYTSLDPYNRSMLSPSIALIYKPIPEVSLYASYNEALQKGPTSPSTGVNNPNVTLDPYVARQEEVGVKATVGGKLDLNGALFRIEQAYAYTNALSDYIESGTETHLGAEFIAKGKLTDRLSVTGGFTVLDATVKGLDQSNLNGKVPVGVPRTMARLYAEYSLPFLPELTLTGGVSYNGSVYVNAANSLSIPEVTTGDLGARYAMHVGKHELTLRFNVDNFTDENYWTCSGSSLALGAPRTFAFSAQMTF